MDGHEALNFMLNIVYKVMDHAVDAYVKCPRCGRVQHVRDSEFDFSPRCAYCGEYLLMGEK